MDAAVSAFSIYSKSIKPRREKSNKKKNSPKRKHNKRRNNNEMKVASPVTPPRTKKLILEKVPEHEVIKVAQKVKKQQMKLKKPKQLVKHIEKPLKQKDFIKKDLLHNKPITRSPSVSSEDIPMLVPARLPNNHFVNHNSNASTPIKANKPKIPFKPVETDSAKEGLSLFEWMIYPYNVNEFFKCVWEKKPLHIARNKPTYYKDIISTAAIDDILKNDNIQFGKNIDVTTYINEQRETHNPDGKANAFVVWDFYLRGCSIRFLNPQTYIPKLHLLNATLQEFFNSFVGANAYLTPPDSQGFAPHFDDIEAFVLQTEGKKRWKVYKPRHPQEVLARLSSQNFEQNEIGEPILEVVLEAGDMLYFPRGYIHQAETIDGEHSLHVTVSMYQKHSWADLLEKMIPQALQTAINENVDMRQGLPFDLYDNFGIVHSDVDTPRKKQLEDLILSLFEKVKPYLDLDGAVDQLSKRYQEDALPPVLTDAERAVTVFGDSDIKVENGKVTRHTGITLNTDIRLLRKNILRIVAEESIKIYYHVENSMEFHGSEVPFIEIEDELAPAVETLIKSYPSYVSVRELGLPDNEENLDIAKILWGRGLIMTTYPVNDSSVKHTKRSSRKH